MPSNVNAGGAASGGSAVTAGTPTAGAPAGAENGGAPSSGGSGGDALGAGGAATSSGGAWTLPAGVTKPRIMIVGDSISAGPGCYKKHLLQKLHDSGYTQFDFVGQYADDCGGGVRHSAVSCSTAEQYTQAMFTMPNCAQDKSFPGMSSLVAEHTPDLVMLQLGVNDVWGGRATDDILASYTALVEQARARNPRVAFVVAQIGKIAPSCTAGDPVTARAEALVEAVPAWARKLGTAQSPVFTADLWTNSDWSKTETNDCVHPNDIGAERMGNNWYESLKSILKRD